MRFKSQRIWDPIHNLIEFEADEFEHTLWKDRLDAQARRLDHVGDDDTFAANVEVFLQTKRNEVAAGQLSAARADLLRIYLDLAMDYIGKKSSVAQIDAALLASFRNHLLERMASKEISGYYGRDVFAAFKLFTRWVANNTDKLEALPRNIDDKRLNIAISRQKAKTLSTEAIKQLLKQATDRTRLYLLLGLNCAMTQQDMSDLHPSEVDWTAGLIRRKRSKTAAPKHGWPGQKDDPARPLRVHPQQRAVADGGGDAARLRRRAIRGAERGDAGDPHPTRGNRRHG
jgi:hypothetical protein